MSIKTKISTRTWLGFIFGVVLTSISAVIVIPQHSDYIGASQTSRLFGELLNDNNSLQEIEQKILNGDMIKAGQLKLITDESAKRLLITFSYINEHGEIFIKLGKEGQFIWLKPQVTEGSVDWLCVGGSNHDISHNCTKDTTELHKIFYNNS